MTTTHKTFIIIAVLAIVALTYSYIKKGAPVVEPVAVAPQTESIEGCYVSRTDKDVYTLNIKNQDAASVSGTLAFKNFEKDSSSGNFAGTYNNGILFGDYSFASEGMDSVMEVAFKKEGDAFIRGYGPVIDQGTRFESLDTVTYERSTLSVFEKEACL